MVKEKHKTPRVPDVCEPQNHQESHLTPCNCLLTFLPVLPFLLCPPLQIVPIILNTAAKKILLKQRSDYHFSAQALKTSFPCCFQ